MSDKPRPIVSVYIDIARFSFEVFSISDDKELGKWTRKLAECLATREPSLHKFGGRLLTEAADFVAGVSEKRKQAADKRWEDERRRKAEEEQKSRLNQLKNAGALQKDAQAMQNHATDHADHADHADQELRKQVLVAGAPGDVENKKRTREPNPIFDAVVSLFGFSAITPSTGKRIGKVTAELRSRGATADTVAAAYATAEKIWNVPFKPEALVVNWELLQRSQNVGNGTGKNIENGTGKRNRREGEFHEDLKL